MQVSLLLIAVFSVSAAAGDGVYPLQPLALDYTGTHTVTAADPNLTGEGVVVAAICRSMTYRNGKPQNDYRFNMDHDSLYKADVAFEDGSDGRFSVSSHATAVAGILIGNDDNAQHTDTETFSYRGACPEAVVDVYEFRRFETLYLFDKQPFAADIITLSLGEQYEDWWTRALDNLAAVQDSIIIASIGNGAGTDDLLYPGAGANAIGVGVIDAAVDENGLSLSDFSTPNAYHSSAGPTDNNRCKPDLVAPGTALVPMHTSDTDYTVVENWSSLAAPVVSGTTALLLQKAYTDPDISTQFDRPGKNMVIKAILINSAAKLPYWHKGAVGDEDDTTAPLDYTQGAGALDAERAMAQLTDPSGWDNRMLSSRKTSVDYEIDAAEPNQILTATLCWNRFYKNDYPFDHDLEKDTDLRLELWGKLADDPNEILLDFSDSVNDNVEHIYFQCIEGVDTYRLRVTFNDQQAVTDKTRQRFALAYHIGADTAAANKWWYDVNGDNQINPIDQVAYQMIDHKITNELDRVFAQQALGLSSERIALLEANWSTWKTYLNDYQNPSTD
ncbi:MAG: S8 family serine peptidase [Planctomycetota bacterium]|jgi:hypothetical protein